MKQQLKEQNITRFWVDKKKKIEKAHNSLGAKVIVSFFLDTQVIEQRTELKMLLETKNE